MFMETGKCISYNIADSGNWSRCSERARDILDRQHIDEIARLRSLWLIDYLYLTTFVMTQAGDEWDNDGDGFCSRRAEQLQTMTV